MFIRDHDVVLLTGFIQAQAALRGKRFMIHHKNLSCRSRFLAIPQKTKNPAGARFCQWFAGGIREAHCVTSTAKVYVIGGDRAISSTVYRINEYETAQ